MARSKQVIEASEEGAFVYAREGHQRDQIRNLRAETWRGMEEALRQGKVRAIGVSNFTVAHLEALKETATVWPPAVNQVELHPYLQQRELQAYVGSLRLPTLLPSLLLPPPRLPRPPSPHKHNNPFRSPISKHAT